MNVVTKSVVKTVDATVDVTKTAANAVTNLVTSDNSNLSESDKRWKELQTLEKKRRAILRRVEEPFWKTLMHWDGTVLSHLKTDSVLWLTMSLYIATRILAREGLPDFVSSLDSGRMGIVGGFLTFFIVFYVNQSHKRFFQLYGHSMACKGRIFDAATLARSCHMPTTQALRLIRYMNAAHAAAYIGLSSVYPSNGYFDRICIHDFQLLTKTEMERMNTINLDTGGSAYRELIVWSMLEVQKAKDANLIDKELAAMLREQVLQLRAQAGQLYNAADLPIPFFYVHFICLLTALYLPLFAITQGINAGTGDDSHWVVDIVAGLVVFLQSIFIIGLRIVGQKVSDPYGDDLVDLSVMFFIQFTWTQSNRVLNSHDAPSNGMNEVEEDEIEHNLAKERITIGKAWDDGTDQGLGIPTSEIISKKKKRKKKNRKNKKKQDNGDDGDDTKNDPEATAMDMDDSNDVEDDNSGDNNDENGETSSDDDDDNDNESDGSEMNDQIGFGTQQVK